LFCRLRLCGYDINSHKNTSGFIILYLNDPISWSSKKQLIVALSSTKAEFIATAECVKEIMHLKALLKELAENSIKITLTIRDTIQIIKNGIGNKCSKHIDDSYHYLKKNTLKIY